MNRAEPKMQRLCTRTRSSFHRRAARSRGNNPQYQWAGENCQTYAVELGSQANYINVGKCTSILFSFCVSNPSLTDQPFFNAQELASRNWGLGLDDGGDGDDDSLFSIDSTKRSAKHEQKHWQLKSCLESGLSSMWILKVFDCLSIWFLPGTIFSFMNLCILWLSLKMWKLLILVSFVCRMDCSVLLLKEFLTKF